MVEVIITSKRMPAGGAAVNYEITVRSAGKVIYGPHVVPERSALNTRNRMIDRLCGSGKYDKITTEGTIDGKA